MTAASDFAQGADWDAIPSELLSLGQWVGWRLVQRPGAKKPTKQPLRPRDGSLASTTDATTWGTADQALSCPGASGIGFVFTNDDPYVGIDLDACRDRVSGEVDDWAQEIVDLLSSYTEVSPSGTGLHVILRGSIPGDRRRQGHCEMYSEGRYFTMTGNRLAGATVEIAERSDELAKLCGQVFGEESSDSSAAPLPIHASLTDEELIRRAHDAANGGKFRALWAGDITGYASASEADLALCSLIAFWAGPDADRIDRLVRQSGLMRPKWDEKHGAETYGYGTVAKVLAGRTEYYGQMRPALGEGEEARRLNALPRTQSGNAEAFALLHQGEVLFDHRLDQWLLRGEHRWRFDPVDEVVQLAKLTARRRLGAAAAIADDEQRRAMVKHATSSESRPNLEALLHLARSEPGIADRGDAWDAEPMLLGVQNGVVDLTSGILRPGRPNDRIRLAVPVPYRPDATCPRYEQFLDEIFRGDPELIAFIQRAVGYSLTGDSHRARPLLAVRDGAQRQVGVPERAPCGDGRVRSQSPVQRVRAHGPLPADTGAGAPPREATRDELGNQRRRPPQ